MHLVGMTTNASSVTPGYRATLASHPDAIMIPAVFTQTFPVAMSPNRVSMF